jgi:hypothetical protein
VHPNPWIHMFLGLFSGSVRSEDPDPHPDPLPKCHGSATMLKTVRNQHPELSVASFLLRAIMHQYTGTIENRVGSLTLLKEQNVACRSAHIRTLTADKVRSLQPPHSWSFM